MGACLVSIFAEPKKVATSRRSPTGRGSEYFGNRTLFPFHFWTRGRTFSFSIPRLLYVLFSKI
jgi:hypothetical protein